MNWLVLFGIISLGLNVSALKILFLGPFRGKSHTLYCQSFVLDLLKRGHDVTFLTSFTMKHMNLANYTEVLADPPWDFSSLMTQDDLSKPVTPFTSLLMMAYFPLAAAEKVLETENVKNFINSNARFDIVMNEEFFHDSFLMFGHIFKAPMVTICPFGYSDFFERQQGLLTPWSFVPHMTLTYTDNMSFTERWYNAIVSAADWVIRRWIFIPGHQALANKFFGHLGEVPSIDDLNKNVSIVFVNSHRSLAPPRPSMPNIIEIGGSHIKPAKALPADLKAFLDGAKDGAIYMSFGTVMQSSKMSKTTLNAFLKTFKQIKQRVIWKYEDDSLTDLPPNVLIQKWLPQSDILAHPNVRMFISHGGLFSTLESLDRGVPLLVVPFFGDQQRNGQRVATSGYGKVLPFIHITDEAFFNSVNEVLLPKYFNRAKELQSLWKDNMNKPMDVFHWWVEHVVKYKGAKHLKSHATEMSWCSYLLLDVIAATLAVVFGSIYIFYIVVKKLCCRKQTGNKKQKQN